MKKHGQSRFDITKRPQGVDVNPSVVYCKLPAAQIRDLTDTRSLEDFANRLNAARRDYRRFCFTVLITAIALASAALLAGYIISNL